MLESFRISRTLRFFSQLGSRHSKMKKFIDIGANLTDSMYSGVYNGSKKHEDDLKQVLERSWKAGLTKIIVTGGNLSESQRAFEISKSDDRLFFTVGCHPTRCQEFNQNPSGSEDYLSKLKSLITQGKNSGKVVAVGECGLDYDRLQFCPKDIQLRYFESQLKLSQEVDLPLFLHCRNAADDLFGILKKYSLKGVVHSFDGTIDEATRFTELGYYVGLNGCSLKTSDNLETVAKLPREKILIETDCPWCEIRPTHAGYQHIEKNDVTYPSVKKEKWKADHMVKSRNEPCNIRQVLDIIAKVRNEDAVELSDVIYRNTEHLFFQSNK